ncbi:MAG: PASTA domain-containing protein [Burkholderiales bacterium]|nr:PASTA domain-containing protein [Burkholderiales bacterium]
MPSFASIFRTLTLGLAAAFALCASAATPSVGVALDTDDNPATGCTVATANGAYAGVEQVVTARVVTHATGAYVDRVERQTCAGGALGGAAIVDSGDWPVGLGDGAGGSAVVEMSIPRSLLPAGGVAKAVAVADDGGSGADATAPFFVPLARTGGAGGIAVPVPLSPAIVFPLALIVFWSAGRFARRRPERARLAGVLFVFAFAGLAWAAAAVVRDGAIGDWAGVAPVVGDPPGDGAPDADLVAVYVQGDDTHMHVRIDADIRADGGGTGNAAPTVNAGPGQTITLPAGATLSGSATDDGRPSPPGALSVAWTLDSGPSGALANFSNPASPTSSVTFNAPGSYVLRLTANDGALAASATTTITVQDGAPQLAAIADRTIELGTRLQIVLEAKDGNAGDALAFSLPTAPAGAALRPAPLVDWMPTSAQIGTHPFTARVTDGSGASASRSFNVTVRHTNRPPVIAPQASEVVRGGATFVRRIIATDPDEGDTLTTTLVTGPPGMTISGDELLWPTAGATPGDRTVNVRVRDAAGLTDQTSFTLTLLPAAAPVAVDDAYEVRVGETRVVPAAGVPSNDQNPSGGPMSAVKKTDPALGTLSAFGADGGFTFVAPASPPAHAFGLTEVWRNDAAGQFVNSFPVVGDVNGDGYPDLVLSSQFVGHRAVDLRTGATLWGIDATGYADCYFGFPTTTAPLLTDVDDDGELEYVGNLASCERDSNIPAAGYAPADRIFALNGRTGAVKWISERVSRPLGDVLAPGTPPSTEDRFQHVYAGAQYASMHVTRLAAGAAPTILFRQTLRADAGYYQPVTGPARSTGCRALTGLPADDNVACRATILMRGDGSIESILTAPNPSNQSQASWDPMRELAPFTVDVDGDGVPEIVSGSDVWKNVGGAWTLHWQSEIEPIQVLAADLDGDGAPEIVHVLAMDKTGSGASPRGQFGGDLYKFNGILILDGATGAEKRRIRLPTYWTSWLTIADLDGDGTPEFVWNTQGSVYAIGTDGRIRWTYAFIPGHIGIDPGAYSGTANVQVYDLDGDGVPEVVTNSHSEIVVLSGRTGAVRASHPSSGLHGGYYTGHNVQIVDADADGHVDILATNVSGPDRLSYLMLRGAPNAWLPGPKVHPQVNFVNGDFSGNGHAEFNAGVPTQFRNPAQQGTVGDPRETEGTSFTYAIDDGSGEGAPATVFVAIKPANLPPVITSTPPSGLLQRFAPTPPGGLVTNYYQPTAIDPDAGDTLTWSLVSAPAWVTMEAGGRIRFEPTCGSYGYPCGWGWTFVVLRVTDSLGAYAEQSFMVNLTTTAAVVPDVVGDSLATANAAIAAASLEPRVLQQVADASPAGTVLAQDPVAGAPDVALGATVWMTVSKGPQPVAVPFVVGKTLAQANALIGAVGLATSVSTVFSPTVPAGDVTAQSPDFGTMLLPGSAPPVALTVSAGAPLAKPVASLVVEPGPGPLARLAGETQAFKATAVFDDGTSANVTYAATWLSSASAVASVDATGAALAKTVGAATISATIGGKTGQATIAVSALALGDATPPVAAIAGPADGASVTGPVDVTGTATDPNFLRYELAFALAGDDTWTVIGEGTSPVASGVLGTFDPTVLVNDLYTLRLRVFDKGENVSEASVTVQATGQRKVGLFTLEYVDLNLPSAGVPLTLKRIYDSRDKASRDFGVGWRLAIDTLRIRTNRVLGTGWVRTVSGPVVSLAPTSEHRVSVTLPDGTVEVFDLRVSPTSNLGSLDFTSVIGFDPRPGALGTLEALANPDLLVVNGGAEDELVDDSTLDTYQPKLWRYTTVDGTKIEVSPTDGVKKITDRNGNEVAVGPGGILHSDGTGIVFTRDAKGRIVAVTDPAGNVQSYAYDVNGDLVAHADPTGAVSRYAYDRHHGLIEVRDPLGVRRTRNEYDETGRLLSMTDAAGNAIHYTRDESANLEIVTDRLGRQTRLVYDANGNVLRRERGVTIEGMLVNAVTTSAYDAQGNETSRADPDGVRRDASFVGRTPVTLVRDPSGLNLVTSFTFDARQQITGTTDAAGRTASFAYDAQGSLTSATLPGLGLMQFTNDAQGLPIEARNALGTRAVRTRDALGRVVREEVFDSGGASLSRVDFGYDASGNKTSETHRRTVEGAPTSLTTQYAYDAANRLVRVTDPLGGVRRVEHDATGRVVAVVDPLGRRTTLDFDSLGRPVRTTYPDGTFEETTYDAEGNDVATRDRAGRVTSRTFDEANRVVSTTRPDGAVSRTVYTPAGRVAASIDELGHRTDYAYDALGRRTGVTQPAVPDGPGGPLVRPVWTTAYDSLGRVSSTTDPYGRVTSYQYDLQGKLIRTTYPDGTFTQQAWDANGRRTSATNEEGQVTTYGYDALGRVVAVGGHGGSVTHAYDEAGNRVSQTDALGRVTRMRYDALNRMVERRYPSGASESFAYDAVGNRVGRIDGLGRLTAVVHDTMDRRVSRTLPGGSVVTYAYAPDGQRSSVADAHGVIAYAYDAAGRLASVTQPAGDVVSYGHDAAGRLASLVAPASVTVYGRDALGRLTRVTTPEGAFGFDLDLVGNRVRRSAPNGLVSDSTFDLRDRPATIVQRNGGGTTLSSWTIAYTPTGRRSSIAELDGSVETYAYDTQGRLVSETRTGTGSRSVSHAYDAVGNRTQRVRDGTPTAFAYDVDDRVVAAGAATYAWNASGNLVSRTLGATTTTYGYDADDRLVSMLGGGLSMQYRLNDDGHRVQSTSSAGVTRFLVDAANESTVSQVLEERDGGGTLTARYVIGSEALSMTRGANASVFLTDPLGSVRGLVDAAGGLTDGYRYDGFGALESASGVTISPHRYRGERIDETGFVDLRARAYDPTLGRFLTRDPFGGDPDAPLSLHRYQYANADPVNHVDPDGRMGLPEISVVSQIMAGLAVARAFADFGGEVYRGKAVGVAALGAAQTLAFDLAMIGAGEAVGALVLGPLMSVAARNLGPLAGNVTKAFGSWFGATGAALSKAGALEYGRALKTIFDLYGKYGGTLANIAGGTVKPGLEAEAKIALASIRTAVINLNRRISPEVTKFLLVKLRELRDKSGQVIIEEGAEILETQTLGKGWALFIDTVIGVL